MDSRKTPGGSEQNAMLNSPIGSSRELLLRYNHCAICDSRLHFSYVTDYSRNLTEEHVKCPECGIKVRQISHRLQ